MPPLLSPSSQRAPAQAARSPSPEQSMKMSARTACRPALVSTIIVPMRVSSSITKRVEQHIDPVSREQIVRRDFVGGGVIGLRQNLSQNQMRCIEAAEPVDARQQIGRDALHDAMHLAMDIGVQSAKIRHSRRRAHAAEESIALD